MISKIGAKEFKERVKNKLMQVNNNINENDLYFSQTTTGYDLEYRPRYPRRTLADLLVHQDLNGSITLYGNIQSLISTIREFEDIEDFEMEL